MELTINPHNTGELEGIREVLPGASLKYVFDLTLDGIVYQWGLRIPHTKKTSTSRKMRLNGRHIAFVTTYSTERHVSMSVGVNLILNDYFYDRMAQISSDKSQTTSGKSEITTTATTTTETEQTQTETDKPKPLRGAALLKNLTI